jgi:hypothetical protein
MTVPWARRTVVEAAIERHVMVQADKFFEKEANT